MKRIEFDHQRKSWDRYRAFHTTNGPFTEFETGEVIVDWTPRLERRGHYDRYGIQLVATSDDDCPMLYTSPECGNGDHVPKAWLNHRGQQPLAIDWEQGVAVSLDVLGRDRENRTRLTGFHTKGAHALWTGPHRLPVPFGKIKVNQPDPDVKAALRPKLQEVRAAVTAALRITEDPDGPRPAIFDDTCHAPSEMDFRTHAGSTSTSSCTSNRNKEETMSRNNKIIRRVNGRIGKDKAVTQIDITIDMAQWSTRKRNIIIDAVENNVVSCGAETSELVHDLLSAFGGGRAAHMTHYKRHVTIEEIDPEKVQDCIAHVAAMLKLEDAAEERPALYAYYRGFVRDRFDRAVEEGAVPYYFPLPRYMTQEQRADFARAYMKTPDERENLARQRLVEAVRNGETVTVNLQA